MIGINERDATGGTLYNTLAYIGDDGRLLGKHRKLVPTLSERLVWGLRRWFRTSMSTRPSAAGSAA